MRLLFFFVTIPACFVILSCSTTSSESYSNDVEAYFLLYKKAKELELSDNTVEKIQSCETFKKLSKEDRFPLRKMAVVRAKIACDRVVALVATQKRSIASNVEVSAVDNNEFQNETQEKWLQETYSSFSAQEKDPAKKIVVATNTNTDNSPMALARQAFADRKFKEGRKQLQKVVSNKKAADEDRYRARRQIRQSYKTEQNKEQYLKECAALAKWSLSTKKADRIHEAYVTYARALWTEGFVDKGRKQLEIVDKKLDKKYPRDEIFMIRARMAEETKDWQEALNYYNKAEKAMRNTNERVLFGKAWVLRKMARYQEASEVLNKLKVVAKDFVDKNKYSFWLGRVLKDMDQKKLAQEEFEDLTKRDNLGYYGLLAYRELGQPLPAMKHSMRSPASNYARFVSDVDSDTRQTVRALQYAAEDVALEKFLNERSSKAFSEASMNEILFYMHTYAQLGSFMPVFTRLPFLSEKLRMEIAEYYPELAFPKKYMDYIDLATQKFGIAPELVLSIIRQESAFNPNARSPADAFGLMQVIPKVAKVHRQKADAHWTKYDELFNPQINISLGTSLLKTLKARYNNQFIPMVAAYNASHTAIEGWLATRYHEDPLEFIEDIPYEETKGYVKMVMRNYVFYTRMAQPGIPVLFPEWCLENLRPTNISTNFE